MTFLVGGLMANLPALYFLVTRPADFLFGNLHYAHLNTVYRQEMSFSVGMTILGKCRYLMSMVFAMPGDLVVVMLGAGCIGLVGIEIWRSRTMPRIEVTVLLLCVPVLYAGAMLATPSWYQYYFAPVPFVILLAVYVVSTLRSGTFSRLAATVSVVVAAVLSAFHSPPGGEFGSIREVLAWHSWRPVGVHREAVAIRSYIGTADPVRVLTLSPLYAVESGLGIYREFVTGPFAWRVRDLVPEQEAAKRGLPPQQVAVVFKEKRPRALLTGGDEAQVELPLVRQAERLGYLRIPTATGIVVWLEPK
jgi:hypothetical protein